MRTLLNNNKGVALIMVLTAITIMTALLADFTFDIKLNKIKTYHQQDKLQSRLNAEAGLNFAMVRLKLFKEALNLYHAKKNIKNNVKVIVLNKIWSIPFVYPIPITDDTNLDAKQAIENFMDNSLLKGQVQVAINNISSKFNLNLLRASSLGKEKSSQNQNDNDNSEGNGQKGIYDHLIEFLSNKLQRTMDESTESYELYQGYDAKLLISSLRYYVSDRNSIQDEFTAEIESYYSGENITPKFAPLASLSELNLVYGWDDQIIKLIEDEVTVYGAVYFDLNEVTSKTIKILFPELDDDQVAAFFEYKNNPESPKEFNEISDFKNYFVSKEGIFSSEEFDQRIKEFEAAGIKFGVTGSLFRVQSKGAFEDSEYTINAIVSIPLKPQPKKEDEQKNTGRENENQEEDPDKKNNTSNKGKEAVETPPEYLEPRIVDILIE